MKKTKTTAGCSRWDKSEFEGFKIYKTKNQEVETIYNPRIIEKNSRIIEKPKITKITKKGIKLLRIS
ncbi:hypothetical protein [Neisseria meningitidis]|uniref:hypothetical protein n=1 Tax=Neisseria meningitidis TaxID=487 RepID=UPI001C5B44DF|nr:hypothetical protein [Neisseria meningitidis]QXZ28611.1 hypothetical protein KZH42_07090 [Neisseria meningitidis]